MFLKHRNILNYAPLACAVVCVSLIHGAPHIIASNLIGEGEYTYEPITIESNFDEATVYGPRARKSFEGEGGGDFMVFEHVGEPTVLPLLNPMIIGALASLAGSFRDGVILGDFLIPPIIFSILYLLLFALCQSRAAALLFATYFILSPQGVMLLPPTSYTGLIEFFNTLLPFKGGGDPLFFSRIEYPQATFVFYALAMYLLYRTLSEGKQWYVIGTGIAFGLTFYTYLYDWAYTFVGLCILLFIFVIRKEYIQAKKIVMILAIGLAMSLAYWVNFASIHALPHYADVVQRMGVELSNDFRLSILTNYFRSATLIGLLWLLARRRPEFTLESIYVSSFLAASFAVYNAQVIVGFNPQPDHWYRLQFLPVLLAFVLMLVFVVRTYIRDRAPRMLVYVLSFAVPVSLIAGTAVAQYAYISEHVASNSISRTSLESYGWLKEHTTGDDVVGTLAPKVNSELLLYTDNKLYVPNGLLTAASTEELWQRFYYMLAVFGYTVEDFELLLQFEVEDDDDDVMLYVFQNAFNETHLDAYLSGPHRSLSEAESKRRIAEYKAYIMAGTEKVSPKYRLDYLFVDTSKADVALPLRTDFEEVYASGTIRILKKRI